MVKLDSRRIGPNAVLSGHVADGEIQTPDLADAGVTMPKLADGSVSTLKIAGAGVRVANVGYQTVDITVTAGSASGSSPADAALVGAEILGYYSTGNQDQLVDDITLAADGSITITLAAAATADNTFRVVCLRA